MIRSIATLALAVLLAAPSYAATYRYEGQPLPWSRARPGHEPPLGRPLTGEFTLNEALYPGRKIAGSTLTLTNRFFNPDLFFPDYISQYSIEIAGMKFTDKVVRPQGSPWPFTFFSYSGWLFSGLDNLVGGQADVEISFDQDGNIIDWRIDTGMKGGLEDSVSSPSGDCNGFGCSAGPGKWVTVDAPAAVPLPSSGLLLLGALGLLPWVRRRSRSRGGPTSALCRLEHARRVSR